MPKLKPEYLSQENIVLLLTVALLAGFALLVPGFASAGNLIALVRGVSILGVLAIGMGLVVIGRGIDLSMVAVMALSVTWMLSMANDGTPLLVAAGWAFLAVIAVGVLNGVMIAYAEVPALFATLATGSFVYGFGRSTLITQDTVAVTSTDSFFQWLGATYIGPFPIEIIFFAGTAILAEMILRMTVFGKYVYLMGDNYLAARNVGIPVRPMIVAQYLFSSLVAFTAGIITAANLLSMSTRIVNSQLLYDIILVVVVGGIGLNGGKGGIRNVVIGALLVGILSNGLTILDVPDLYQKLVKALVLLCALIADSLLNPRNEQTEKQGDI
ncbi:ABC transporter permease [Mesorhizobium argentiipisi]|uniref:ABC transporter permease n=1 Tax=Mesorhizobium argentiipisi TaxID=3015175 RepID=A0ABU8KA93_9HYPH